MEYQEFKQRLLEGIKEVFPKEQGYEVLEQRNQETDLLKVRRASIEMEAAMPINSLFQIMKHPKGNLHSVVELVQETVQGAEQVMEAADQIRSIDMKSYESVKDRLLVELERSEQNGVFLTDGIYEKQAFGALVPYVSVPLGEGGVRARITPEMLESYGITQRELMERAMSNTQAVKPSRIIKYDMEKTGVCYAVTDQKGRNATAVMYPGVLEELRQKIGSDYYVVPVSLREVVAIGKNENITISTLRKALQDENRRNPQEWLSSKIYEYNGEEKKLSVCKPDKMKKQER